MIVQGERLFARDNDRLGSLVIDDVPPIGGTCVTIVFRVTTVTDLMVCVRVHPDAPVIMTAIAVPDVSQLDIQLMMMQSERDVPAKDRAIARQYLNQVLTAYPDCQLLRQLAHNIAKRPNSFKPQYVYDKIHAAILQ